MARSAKFQQNQGICRGHAVCTWPIYHDRSGGLGGSTGGGEVSGASAPSAGGGAPPGAGDTSVATRFRYSAKLTLHWGPIAGLGIPLLGIFFPLALLTLPVCAVAKSVDRGRLLA